MSASGEFNNIHPGPPYTQLEPELGLDESGTNQESELPMALVALPEIVHSFKCPITYQPFVDPVIASDNITYERFAIERWIHDYSQTDPATGRVLPPRSPCTNKPLVNTHLLSNLAIKNAMQEFQALRQDTIERSTAPIRKQLETERVEKEELRTEKEELSKELRIQKSFTESLKAHLEEEISLRKSTEDCYLKSRRSIEELKTGTAFKTIENCLEVRTKQLQSMIKKYDIMLERHEKLSERQQNCKKRILRELEDEDEEGSKRVKTQSPHTQDLDANFQTVGHVLNLIDKPRFRIGENVQIDLARKFPDSPTKKIRNGVIQARHKLDGEIKFYQIAFDGDDKLSWFGERGTGVSRKSLIEDVKSCSSLAESRPGDREIFSVNSNDLDRLSPNKALRDNVRCLSFTSRFSKSLILEEGRQVFLRSTGEQVEISEVSQDSYSLHGRNGSYSKHDFMLIL